MAIKPGISKYDWEIELTDTKSRRKYGLKVPQGSLQIGTISQDDTVYVRDVGKRVGDFDEQRSWKGGRGQENLNENPEAYWDSLNAWTLTDGHAHQTLQWYHARGLRNEDLFMPTYGSGSVEFIPVIGTNRYITNSFVASASYTAVNSYLWIRRRGTPKALTVNIYLNGAGIPGVLTRTTTVTVNNVTDYVGVYLPVSVTPNAALTGAATYWFGVEGDASDDQDNHWEVGVNPNISAGKISSNGSSWSSASFALYYRITDADIARRWMRFNLQEAFYIIDQKDNNTTASVIYINGDRGLATGGSASSLTDSSKAWVVNRFAGAMVKIIGGTGIRNTPKRIVSNTATALTVSGTWETNPDATTQYLIYATDWFTPVTFSGGTPTLGVVSAEPAVANNVAYIPQGTDGIIHMRWNSTTNVHEGFKETKTGVNGSADFLTVANDPTDGVVIWRANNWTGTGSGGFATVSRAKLIVSNVFIAWNVALTFEASIFTGSTAYRATNVEKHQNTVYVFREDGIGIIANNRYTNIETGIEKTPSRANGATVVRQGQYLYYSWLHSVVRIYGSSHDDIGDDYRGIGLPQGREGEYSDGESYLKLVFFSIDAGAAGTSSVLAWDGLGWHEVVRSPRLGARARMVKMQVCPGTLNRLFSDFGGDLVYQAFPVNRSSPRLGTGSRYMQEGVIESSSIDMGTASGLAKFIKELTVTVRNLNTAGRHVYVDIQTDDDVHTSKWTYVDVMSRSPESTVFLGLQNVRRFAYRLRLCSNDSSVPIDVEGVVPNGFARVPFRMVFTMQVQAGGIFSRRGKAATAGELMRWLLDAARQPGRVRMDSVYEMAHGWHVIVHPPRMFPQVPKKGKSAETASFTLVLQEA